MLLAKRTRIAVQSADDRTSFDLCLLTCAGALMTEAQRDFDARAAPLCLEHLASPVLHRVLAFELIQAHIWGGKGVGSQASSHGSPNSDQKSGRHAVSGVCASDAFAPHAWCQGDGTAQLVCRGAEQQQRVCEILKKELGVHCTKLTLQPTDAPVCSSHLVQVVVHEHQTATRDLTFCAIDGWTCPERRTPSSSCSRSHYSQMPFKSWKRTAACCKRSSSLWEGR